MLTIRARWKARLEREVARLAAEQTTPSRCPSTTTASPMWSPRLRRRSFAPRASTATKSQERGPKPPQLRARPLGGPVAVGHRLAYDFLSAGGELGDDDDS
jgi:hypothetical protein